VKGFDTGRYNFIQERKLTLFVFEIYCDMKQLLFFLLLAGGMAPSFANLRLPAVISSGMVLQQHSDVSLWGWCDPGEKISVSGSWDHRIDSAIGTRDGKWEVSISTPVAGGPYTVTLNGRNTIVLDNVLIGEVWICSGQSNMEMCETWGEPDVRTELASCYNDKIRMFHIARATSAYPQDDCTGRWAVCDSNELKNFSSVGYFFSRKLNAELNVPVGIMEAAWGGTPAEVWTPAETLKEDAALTGAATLLKPANGWPYLPGYCYNAMIAPVTSYGIAGALWYQGEGNVTNAGTYGRLFTTMIGSWRKAWNKSFPFYFVQIAPYTYGPGEGATILREQQANSLKLAGTGMVVISDIAGDTTNIHPKDKHDVGYRLAGWALAETYHREGIAYKNPAPATTVIKGNKIEVTLADAGNGLVIRGSAAAALWIAGEDKVFYPAVAGLRGNTLIVSSSQVRQPVAVRYQFSNAGVGNIFSKEGLPVAPFRTDDWKN
jgi:sialate O-acetylesterase